MGLCPENRAEENACPYSIDIVFFCLIVYGMANIPLTDFCYAQKSPCSDSKLPALHVTLLVKIRQIIQCLTNEGGLNVCFFFLMLHRHAIDTILLLGLAFHDWKKKKLNHFRLVWVFLYTEILPHY